MGAVRHTPKYYLKEKKEKKKKAKEFNLSKGREAKKPDPLLFSLFRFLYPLIFLSLPKDMVMSLKPKS